MGRFVDLKRTKIRKTYSNRIYGDKNVILHYGDVDVDCGNEKHCFLVET